MTGRSIETGLGRVVLFAAAALVFYTGPRLLDTWLDLGVLVYPSWRVSEGAVPYRDLQALYGPGFFYLNGALFRVFGSDLSVLWGFLALLKASIAAFVYAGARRLASRYFALVAYALLVAVWATPWWIFTHTPYAHHYGLALALGGMLLFLSLPARLAVRSACAGLCFGLAILFKQTTGAVAFIAFVWYLLGERGAEPGGSIRLRFPAPAVRALRWLALGASLGILALSLLKHPHAWTWLVLLGPATLTALGLGWRELRDPAAGPDHVRFLLAAGSCSLGVAVPLLAVAAYFHGLGALGDLFRDTIWGLPQQIEQFVPVPTPTGPSSVPFSGWKGAIFAIVYALPFLTGWAVVPVLLRARAYAPALLLFYAVASLLHLYPDADFWHSLLVLPPFLVALAHLLDRLGRVPRPGFRLALPAAVAVAAAVAAAPFVATRVASTREYHRAEGTRRLERATGFVDPGPEFQQLAALVAFLDEDSRADRQVFALTAEQILYFLSDRRSPADPYERTFYALCVEGLSDRDAHAAVDEGDLVRRLERSRALVVDREGDPCASRVRSAFPALRAHLDRHYRPAATAGDYVVLRPRRARGAR